MRLLLSSNRIVERHLSIPDVVLQFILYFATDTSVYDGCNFCNSRVAHEFSFCINISNMATDYRFIFVEQDGYSLLSRPYCLVSVIDLHATFFAFCNESQELCCAISYFKLFCHTQFICFCIGALFIRYLKLHQSMI